MHIHVATFESDTTLAGLDYALDIAGVSDASITTVYVVGPPTPRMPGMDDPADEWAAPADSSSEEPGGMAPTAGAGEEGGGQGLHLTTDTDWSVVTEGERVLERARERAAAAGVDIRTELLYGNPSRAVVTFAESDGASLVIVERPKEEPDHASSPARRVADDAHTPVVVVPA
jgi:nucleotide-binding universal stress UspA family protein